MIRPQQLGYEINLQTDSCSTADFSRYADASACRTEVSELWFASADTGISDGYRYKP